MEERGKHWNSNRRKIARNAAYVRSIRESGQCVDCGSTDAALLEFDHLPHFPKVTNVSKMAHAPRTLATIQREIAKCELRCRSCHERITVARRCALPNGGRDPDGRFYKVAA